MSLTDQSSWGEVERLAQLHEAHINKVMLSAGLPLVRVTVTDRKNGAIVEAMAQLKAGDSLGAWETLNEGLKL